MRAPLSSVQMVTLLPQTANTLSQGGRHRRDDGAGMMPSKRRMLHQRLRSSRGSGGVGVGGGWSAAITKTETCTAATFLSMSLVNSVAKISLRRVKERSIHSDLFRGTCSFSVLCVRSRDPGHRLGHQDRLQHNQISMCQYHSQYF